METIDSLRHLLRLANYRYYVLAEPMMTDYDYDMMIKQLEKLEAEHPECYDENSPTIKPGSDNADDYKDILGWQK